MSKDNIYVILPAYNEEFRLVPVLEKLQELGYHHVIVVSDGSGDHTARIARENGAMVLEHLVNLGPGAATQTGITFALSQGAQYLVTIDADGQHFPEDIDSLIEHIQSENLDLVIGSRFQNKENEIPWHRILYNKIGNVVTFFLTGVYVTDSQSGLKAFSAGMARKIHISLNGYEFCTEIIKFIRQFDVNFAEHPIRVYYSQDTMSKGQGLVNGIRMLGEFFKKLIIHP